MSPCCMLLVVEARGVVALAIALGPVFSSHVWSTIWLAIFWPRRRLSCGAWRWMIAGTNPREAEKW